MRGKQASPRSRQAFAIQTCGGPPALEQRAAVSIVTVTVVRRVNGNRTARWK